MKVRKGDIIELWVDRTAYGGQGVARLDGLVIFIRGAIPGDRVMAPFPVDNGLTCEGIACEHVRRIISHPPRRRVVG